MNEYTLLNALYELCIKTLNEKGVLHSSKIKNYIEGISTKEIDEKITFIDGEISGIKMSIETVKELIENEKY